MEEWATSANRSHPPFALCRNRENEKKIDNLVIDNGQTTSMKNASHNTITILHYHIVTILHYYITCIFSEIYLPSL